MNKINCIAVDDEPLALAVIERLAQKTPLLNLMATFENPLKAQEFLMNHEVDLILLDVDMPDLTGITFLQTLPHKPLIIFTTAHAEYAIHGFEYDVVDFLLKPILLDRFLRAIHKARHQLTLQEEHAGQKGNSRRDYIFIKSDNRLFKINYTDILFIEGMRDYVAVHTLDQKILTLTSMRQILNKLPSQDFIRVHKSYIVGITHITLVQNNRVMINEHEIPISNTYKEGFVKFIDRMNA